MDKLKVTTIKKYVLSRRFYKTLPRNRVSVPKLEKRAEQCLASIIFDAKQQFMALMNKKRDVRNPSWEEIEIEVNRDNMKIEDDDQEDLIFVAADVVAKWVYDPKEG